jgi:hypothetical protein
MRPDVNTCRDPDLLAAEVRRLQGVIAAGESAMLSQNSDCPAQDNAANADMTIHGWIPVTERLPPPGFGVLIFFRATDNDGTPSCIGCDGNGGLISVAAMDRIDGQYLWTSEYGDETPSHWMPLPAPPTARSSVADLNHVVCDTKND